MTPLGRIRDTLQKAIGGDDAAHDWITCEYSGPDSFLAVCAAGHINPVFVRNLLDSVLSKGPKGPAFRTGYVQSNRYLLNEDEASIDDFALGDGDSW